MNDPKGLPAKPRYLWPWFLLAMLVLGAALAFVWVSAEVKRTKERREFEMAGSGSFTNAPAGTNANPANAAPPASDRLAEFGDTLLGGDAVAGQKVFFEKPEANCGKCHKAGGQGGDNGPPLDGIGARQSREFILESILYPNVIIPTNYATVIVLLKNGGGTSGTIKSETDAELTLITPEDKPVTIQRSEIQERMEGASPMPEGIWQLLTKDDLRNLIEFVATLPAWP